MKAISRRFLEVPDIDLPGIYVYGIGYGGGGEHNQCEVHLGWAGTRIWAHGTEQDTRWYVVGTRHIPKAAREFSDVK